MSSSGLSHWAKGTILSLKRWALVFFYTHWATAFLHGLVTSLVTDVMSAVMSCQQWRQLSPCGLQRAESLPTAATECWLLHSLPPCSAASRRGRGWGDWYSGLQTLTLCLTSVAEQLWRLQVTPLQVFNHHRPDGGVTMRIRSDIWAVLGTEEAFRKCPTSRWSGYTYSGYHFGGPFSASASESCPAGAGPCSLSTQWPPICWSLALPLSMAGQIRTCDCLQPLEFKFHFLLKSCLVWGEFTSIHFTFHLSIIRMDSVCLLQWLWTLC